MISSSEKRIYKNTIALSLRTLLILPIGFFSVRLAFNLLGAEMYGLANLLGGLTTVAVTISYGIANMSRRFLCVSLVAEDSTENGRLFSLILIVYFISAVVFFVVLEFFGVWMIQNEIKIPKEHVNMALLFYQTVIATFILQYLGGAYTTLLTALERISAIAWIGVGETVFHVLLLLLLVRCGSQDVLVMYGVLMFLTALFSFSFYYLWVKWHCPFSAFRFYWNLEKLKALLGFALWQMVASVSGSVYGIVSGVLLNNYFTSVLNAAQGIANMVNGKITTFGLGFIIAAQPQLIKLYVLGDICRMEGLLVRMTKFSFFILLLLGLPIFANLEFLLEAWLRDPPVYSAGFALLGYLTALVNVVCAPGDTVIDATGKIRGMQIFRSVVPWFAMIIIYFGFVAGFGPLWIPFVSLFIAIIGNVVRFMFLQRLVRDFSFARFAFQLIRYVVPVILVGGCFVWLIRVCVLRDTWVSVAGTSLASAVIVALLILFWGLTHDERNEVAAFLQSKFEGVVR